MLLTLMSNLSMYGPTTPIIEGGGGGGYYEHESQEEKIRKERKKKLRKDEEDWLMFMSGYVKYRNEN